LYTLRREASRDLAGVLERVAGIGYAGIETAGLLRDIRPDQFREMVAGLGLRVAGSYLVLSPGESLEAFLDQQEAVGNDVVVSSLGPEDFASPEAVKRAAERFNVRAELVRGRGMRLGYHNHWWEYAPSASGWVPMSSFLEHLEGDVFLEWDVYWAQTEGFEPAAVLGTLGSRVQRLFLKDGPCTRDDLPTALGTGAVDFGAALGAAQHAEWHIVALDEYAGDMFEAVETSYEYLTQHGLSQGRRA
jgi:sugar phosphate isomerase/epimerase